MQGAVLSGCVVVRQWWELDSDHDFLVSKNDLLRYGNHSLTYRIVERIFTQVRSACMCRFEGRRLRYKVPISLRASFAYFLGVVC